MKENSVKKNYIFTLIFQIITIVVPLITTPYLARVLEPSGNGVYSLTNTNVSYFTLVGVLGLGTYGQLEIAKVKDDASMRSRLFVDLMLTRIITHSICILAYIVFIILSPRYTVIYLIQGTLLLASLLDVTWFFQGVEEFKKIAIRNIIIKIISVILIFLLVRKKDDLILYTIIMCASTLLSNLCFYPMIGKYVIKINIDHINVKKHLKGSLVFFLPTIASVIMSSLDKTMIGMFTHSEEENGYYAQAYKIESLCMALFSSYNIVMRSRMAYLFVNKEIEKITKMLYDSLRFVSILSFPISFGMIAITNDFVPWFFGDGYEKVTVLLPIFSTWLIFKSHSNCILEQYIMASGQQKIFNVIVWVGAIFNVSMNLLLIYKYMSVGAAIASVAAELLIYILVMIVSRDKISFKNLLRMNWRYISSSVIMSLTVMLIGLKLDSSMITTFIQIAFGALVYSFLLFLLKDSFFLSTINKVLSKFKK